MPQELITLRYCEKYGIGLTFRSVKDFLAQIQVLIDNPARLEELRQKQLTVRPERSPLDILQKVVSLAEERGA